MDDILERQIKFKEQILKEYLRLAKNSESNAKNHENTIDEILGELQKLYKQREQNQ